MQRQPASAADNMDSIAEAYFPAALIKVMFRVYPSIAAIMSSAVRVHIMPVSSTSSNQAAASIALLAVVLARSLVQMADAMEAAGPQLLFRSLMAKPLYALMWEDSQPGDTRHLSACPFGFPSQYTVEVQWHTWQLFVLGTAQALVSTLSSIELLPGPSAAAAAIAAAAAGEATADTHGAAAPSSSSSSSSRDTAKWSYLLRLRGYNARWAASAATFDSHRLLSLHLDHTEARSGSPVLEQSKQPYADAIELCRALAAAAPLPVVCNNPSCENLAGVSEAAAASKVCSGCRCRYCSAACQQADWKRHKHACRCMAAAGESCV
jgi:hypothetical protein